MADVLHHQPANRLVAGDDLHRTWIEGAQGAGIAHVLELGHDQRSFLRWQLID